MTLTNGYASPGQPYERYKWRHADSGLWERDIDECEGFYTSFCRDPEDADKASFPATGCASFQLDDNTEDRPSRHIETAFRHAWALLIVECPGLSSWIEFDQGSGAWRKVCKPLRDDDVRDNWAYSTFHLVSASSAEEWFNSHPPTFKTPNLFLIQHLTSDEVANNGIGMPPRKWRGSVVLRSPHDTIDGIGLLQLLDRLFELAALNLDEDEHAGPLIGCHPDELDQLLPQPMRVATGIDPVPDPEIRERWQAIQARNYASATAKPRLGLPILGQGPNPGSFRREATVLSEAATASLTAKCRELGVTVTHALSAAMAIALRDLQRPFPFSATEEENGPAVMRYTNNIVINLRPAMSSKSLMHSVGNYHMIAAQSMAIDVPLATPASAAERFAFVARQSRDYCRSVRPSAAGSDSRDLLEFAPMTWDAYTPRPQPSVEGEAAAPKPTIADVAISSLGNAGSFVKDQHGHLTVSGVWVAGVGLGAGVSLFILGWDGKIEVSCVFDEAFHARGSITGFLEKLVSSLPLGEAM